MSTFDPQVVAEKVIESRVDDLLNEDQQFQISVNIKQLATMTGSSVSTLETTFVPLSYVQELQRKVGEKGGKRVWIYPEIRDAWLRYLDERG